VVSSQVLTEVPTGALKVRQLGLQAYRPVWRAMSAFTENRSTATVDEVWFVQHHPVFTQGRAGKAEHILAPLSIDIVQSDRGGQVTYHGPGQLVVYPLIDLRRRKLNVRAIVSLLEASIIELLSHYGLQANTMAGAPGVYIDGSKIASLGLRIRHGCSFHGLSVNIDMDLTPFRLINPCGYPGLQMAQLIDKVSDPSRITLAEVEQTLLIILARQLAATATITIDDPLAIFSL
jgi:lipoyl(octanoyl) transferase